MSFSILGLGTAVPPSRMLQAEAERVARELCCRTAEQATWLPGLYRGTGIDKRHMVFDEWMLRAVLNGERANVPYLKAQDPAEELGPTTGGRMVIYREAAEPLAVEAARQAFDLSGLGPEAITHLVTVSCTGFYAPGIDRHLIAALGLPATTERSHIGYMGCHGALNGLRVAGAFTGADPDCRVLLCAVELCSVHYHLGWEPQKMVANAIFADGAAAVVGVPSAAAPADAWQLRASGSCLFPESADAMTWTIGDHGFEMTLSKKVPRLIAQHLRPWLETWLGKHGLRLGDVASWAVHPGGPKIVGAVEEALTLPRSATQVSHDILANYGNMSSPTVLFILDRLRQAGAARPCVALAFGPGLAAEVALFA